MKRITFALILASFTLALAAQDGIRVNFKGNSPTISDFAWSYLSYAVSDNDDDEDCVDESANAMKKAWIKHRDGLPLDEGETLTIDERNGYVRYESRYEEDLLKMEMCYWNESDGKHKLFAYNVATFRNGKFMGGQYDGLLFYRYDNATKEMDICDDTGVECVYEMEDDAMVTFALPRYGKEIAVEKDVVDVGQHTLGHLTLILQSTAFLTEQVKLGLDGQFTPTDPVQAFLLQLLNLGLILRNADCSQLLVPTFML